ncbi:type II toxin-antitoxin system HipA family toxin [Helicobacter suis]|uniref:type II toxin-antitoxin system HipA family toxin n=1 Tax=Helicobacter suis TaxID=104628 RepID=UPI0021003B51|nr:type II toxin-antitoxin system HipA family toxin [Helicobacter suis]
MEVYSNTDQVGVLEVYATGRNETYYFTYDANWIQNGFEIDPQLPLQETKVVSKELWGAFCDISPDRWGRLIQKREAKSELTDSEYMLGVSDYFRVGSLRLFKEGLFVSPSTNHPKLANINQLCVSAHRVEQGESLEDDLRKLLAPSGSLGGARPKASVLKEGVLYIAKFPSLKDADKQISRCEKTMLDVAKLAKIQVCQTELLETSKGTVLLVKRFDRKEQERIPFKSAMTLLSARDGEQRSYCDLAKVLDQKNKKELFRRMVFNGLFGNCDDHLRNHGVLYDQENKTWNLSPAFDITPESIVYAKQTHALNFIDLENLPSIELFDRIKHHFSVTETLFKSILKDMWGARERFEILARKNGINRDNLIALKNNYQHVDFEKVQQMFSVNKGIEF